MKHKLTSLITLALCGTTLSHTVHADTLIGVYAQAQYWTAAFDGDFGNGNSTGFFENGINERESHTSLAVYFEHGIPLLPNLWIRKNDITYTNTQTLTGTVNLGSVSFDTASPTSYNFDLNHTDIAVYYEILDNWISLDLGIGAKNAQFEYTIRQNSTNFSFSESTTIPMMYGKTAFELPLTGWELTSQIMALSFEDNRIEDVNLELGYHFNHFFKAALGYRQMVIDVETQSLNESKLVLDGAYLSLVGHL